MPQTGASRDLTAGGLSAGTSGGGPLTPASRPRCSCASPCGARRCSTAPRPGCVLLVAEQAGRHPRLERRPAALGPYWDEARQAACRTADADRDVPRDGRAGSVRASHTETGGLTVTAVIPFHDAAGFAAVVTGEAVSGDGGRLVVDGGSTRSVPLRWAAGRCGAAAAPVSPAAAPTYSVELPQHAGTGRVALGKTFAAEWTAQIRAACSQPG